jgi:rhamnose utilization protein RhaD (predicted bifunctional aldolase and dehydrogenase)
MSTASNCIEKQVKAFCAQIGADPLLVQGAGGNVSWKQGGILWIKGSGTWLANAIKEDLFVPVDLEQLQQDLSLWNFDITPKVIGDYALRPSIETILHALMPQKIIVHLHLIQALVYLVSRNGEDHIKKIFSQFPEKGERIAFLKYFKPGKELAREVFQILVSDPNINIIFLKNHGIILGANSIEKIQTLLTSITVLLNRVISPLDKLSPISLETNVGYIPFPDIDVHNLSIDPTLYKRLSSDWVLYPDHVVFLGPKAHTFSSWADFLSQHHYIDNAPDLIFIENKGVFIKPDYSQSKTAQLRCYYDVIARLPTDAILDPLDSSDIKALLDWDAEQHRQNLRQQA